MAKENEPHSKAHNLSHAWNLDPKRSSSEKKRECLERANGRAICKQGGQEKAMKGRMRSSSIIEMHENIVNPLFCATDRH